MVHGLINLARIHSQGLELETAMAEQHQNSSADYYSGSSADETTSCAVESSMYWDGWAHPSNVGDEVSASNFLPDLSLSSPSSSSHRLSFQQTDMLSSWMTTFHPSLAAPDQPIADMETHPALFMHESGLEAALDHHPHGPTDNPYSRINACIPEPTSLPAYLAEDESLLPLAPGLMKSSTSSAAAHHGLQVLGPQSPSSPLAIQNGMLNPLGDPWDGCSACPSTGRGALTSWPLASANINYGSVSVSGSHSMMFIPDHSQDPLEVGGDTRVVSRPRHTDIFIGPNGTIESTPGGWTPQFFDAAADTPTTTTTATPSAVQPMKMMAALREAGESSTRIDLGRVVASSEARTPFGAGIVADFRREDRNAWLGKHRLELSVDNDDPHRALELKRSKPSVGLTGTTSTSSAAPKWGRGGGEILRTYNCAGGARSLASQAMDIIAIGPALNTNGKPRARRGSATDPQSVYARQRRERINDRLKTLQHLVPNGAKVDIVTMLDEAYDYVKFLQYQVTLLKSDESWMHATPYNYNGMDISDLSSVQAQEL